MGIHRSVQGSTGLELKALVYWFLDQTQVALDDFGLCAVYYPYFEPCVLGRLHNRGHHPFPDKLCLFPAACWQAVLCVSEVVVQPERPAKS